MARINTRPPSTPESKPVTHEGAPAVRVGSYLQLRRSVLACLLWEDTFYEDGVSIAQRIAQLVPKCAPEAVRDLAIECRESQKLRHVPLWLARQMAKLPEHRALVAETLERVIQRPDELTEFLALYYADPVPGQSPHGLASAGVKKGLAAAFRKFSEYQLAKYNRADAVKLRDVLFLCHAKPKDAEQAMLWKRLIGGYCETCWQAHEGKLGPEPLHEFIEARLAVPDTWEVQISAAKGDAEATRAQWERLLSEGKLGALALLRNLRNMTQAGIPEVQLAGALARMKTERVLPFRYIAAARHAPQLEPALEQAMLRSLESMAKLPGRTVLLVDVSASMDDPIGGKSELRRMDAACGVAMLLREVCNQIGILSFSDRGVGIPPRRGFALRDAIVHSQAHGGTYTEKAKQVADQVGYDRLIIITDEQSHEALSAPVAWEMRNGIRVPKEKTPTGYVINVGSNKHGIGYGAWTHIDGWSESVVTYIQEVEAA